jgi:hypothetical protein
MPLDPAILDALDEVLAKEPQRPELKTQLRQLVANWFDRNASDDDVARLVRNVSVHPEQEE